jgi:hypothetical protein
VTQAELGYRRRERASHIGSPWGIGLGAIRCSHLPAGTRKALSALLAAAEPAPFAGALSEAERAGPSWSGKRKSPPEC